MAEGSEIRPGIPAGLADRYAGRIHAATDDGSCEPVALGVPSDLRGRWAADRFARDEQARAAALCGGCDRRVCDRWNYAGDDPGRVGRLRVIIARSCPLRRV